MQRVLTFVYKKKKYVSKPWNFQAVCLINAKQAESKTEKVDVLETCRDAVDYLFEGTEATQDILDAAVSSKVRMCNEVFRWFIDDLTGKNEESLQEEEQAEN